MDSFEFNNLKAEKAQAMRNYNRQKLLKKLELFAALALLAWSSYNCIYIPVASTNQISAADFLRHNVAVLGQPLYVFIAVNTLIVVISVLTSTQKPTNKQDVYYEYVTTITDAPRRTSSEADEKNPAPEVPVLEKQIVCVDDNGVINSPVEQKYTVGAAKPKEVCPVQESTVGTVTEVKEYRRTRSERADRMGNMNRGGEVVMRRSETLIRRSSCEMDDLSSEDFRLTVETFIAAKKKTLIKENTLDLKLSVQA